MDIKIIKIDDHYKNLKNVGSGAFGEVFLAETITKLYKKNTNVAYEKIVAIKIMPNGESALNEISNIIKCQSSGVIKVHDSFICGENTYLVMDYVNCDLFDFLEPRVIPLVKTQVIFKQILDAVHFCHLNGVYHRDLKPENILIDKDLHIKLCDFGLSTNEHFSIDSHIGSLSYMAPETFCSVYYNTALADVWSLGIILLKMLVGRLSWSEASFENEKYMFFIGNPEKYRARYGIDPCLFKIIRSVLNPNPKHRMSLLRFIEEFSAFKSCQKKISLNPLKLAKSSLKFLFSKQKKAIVQ